VKGLLAATGRSRRCLACGTVTILSRDFNRKSDRSASVGRCGAPTPRIDRGDPQCQPGPAWSGVGPSRRGASPRHGALGPRGEHAHRRADCRLLRSVHIHCAPLDSAREARSDSRQGHRPSWPPLDPADFPSADRSSVRRGRGSPASFGFRNFIPRLTRALAPCQPWCRCRRSISPAGRMKCGR
jgi:hypothetical protein